MREDHYVQVDKQTAEIVSLLTAGQNLIHIQRTDRNNKPLPFPILWRYDAWRRDSESWEHARARSERERNARFVFEENVQRVSRAITLLSEIDGDAARVLAFRKLKGNYEKLITETLQVKLAQTIDDI